MLAQILWNGLVGGALYGLVAVGYTVIFGVIRVVFFAQGELSMVAPFVAMAVLGAFGSPSDSSIRTLLLSAVPAIAASIACGLIAERLCLRPLRSAPPVKSLITSLGASIILQNIVLLSMGAQPLPFAQVSTAQFSVGGVQIRGLEVAVLVVFVLVVIATHAFLEHHRYGVAIRAVAQSREGAMLMGIRPDRAVTAAFVVAGATAGIAGLFMAAYNGVIRFNMGFVPGIKGFTIAILGGIGNLPGAAAMAVLLGVGEALFAGFVSSTYRDLVVFLVLVGFLALRPRGLLGGNQ